MKLSQLLGERLRQAPSECVAENHKIMLRGGYIKQVTAGIYSLLMPAKRICKKIENIIREEMDKIDGQEVQFPVVMPASLWEESGRYTSIGDNMARFQDRSGAKMVLGMTHEEAAVHMARDNARSYSNYPFMIYQIQTKFRDEARSKGGLVRVREFTMKDAYSFHTNDKDLDEYFDKCLKAYLRIYNRVGINDSIPVRADSGMMGGTGTYEFMMLSDIGEDNIAICKECGYSSNVEASECIVSPNEKQEEETKEVHTPDCKSIEDLSALLKVEPKDTCKAVVYQKNLDDSYIIVFIRGDREVNEVKLTNHLGFDVHPATEITKESNIEAGFIGPVNLKANATLVFDKTLIGCNNLVCGANKENYHLTGMSIKRDLSKDIEFVDVAKSENNDFCPVCRKPSISISKGVEIGHIFKLGKKYTTSMKMTYQDKDGTLKTPTMGCYGIGVGRLFACICEKHHDDFGPIWPISVAPWEVEVCGLNIAKNEDVQKLSCALYDILNKEGVDTLYDDREVSTGVMFNDADLLGCPIRIIVSPRNIEKGIVEVSTRDKSFKKEVSCTFENLNEVIKEVKSVILKEKQDLLSKADNI